VAQPPHAPTWLRRASFSYDLSEIRQEVLQLDSALGDAGEKLPLLNQRFANNLSRAGEAAQANDFTGALIALAVLSGAASFVFFRKLRAE